MGDIIADSAMSRDLEHEHQVKVGFFNSSGPHAVTFEEFSRNFDVVITGDGTLCPVVVAVGELFGAKYTGDMEALRQQIDGLKLLEELLRQV